MRRALAGSIAIHGALGALVGAFATDRSTAPRSPERPRIDVELVDVVAPAAPAVVAKRVDPVAPAPPAVVASGATTAGTRSAGDRATAVPRDRRAPRRDPAATVRDYVAGVVVDGSRGTSSHDGRGAGRSGGAGIGLGDGGEVERPRELPPPPPPPIAAPASRARPARLIYPSRQRDGDADELFLARVVVDREGYVAGARIVRGAGGPREEQASQLIWRFRYAPAFDDAGRAIQSTVDQTFLVGR